MPHLAIWAVQPVAPGSYSGKKITQEIFILEGHPISKIYNSQPGFTGEAEFRVFMYEGEIIGGTSFPVGEGVAG
ncbi:hypothetical protein [Bacillus sp. SG-1]|uniref:hypothetical protein n=1 Tax=Bacillus sp. SG-1 TaxID=161544 RepID=UPI0001543F29|nr:hypothetical protein [Bacillus sp. SG-1]EDL66406.1 hypothetical protein BSG1_03600 [Bacillus sp. SG-1]